MFFVFKELSLESLIIIGVYSHRKMADYKLRYFGFRARGEPIRFLFHYAGIEFEDERIAFEDWPDLKTSLLFHQVPVLEFEGNSYFGGQTICRYLGRQFGLCGSTESEAVRCDEVVDAMQDLVNIFIKYWFEGNEERKESMKSELLETKIPNYFGIFEKCIDLAGGKYLVTDGVTWADLFVVAWIEIFFRVDSELLEPYPKLKELYEEVRSVDAIKDWIEKRPESDF